MENLRTNTAVAAWLPRFETVKGRAQRIEGRVRAHPDIVAFGVVAVAFVFLLLAAGDMYLTPDEALHFGLAKPAGLLQVYRNSLTNAHPPLFFLVLHLWTLLGNSEIHLRLLPTIFGCAFLWFFYRWARSALGSGAALITVIVLALSPVCLPVSAEVRHYSLMLMLAAVSLVVFERALRLRSGMNIAHSSLLLCLAALTHYSALFIVFVIEAYEAARLLNSAANWRLTKAWAACQSGIVATYAVLYLTQVRYLRGSNMEAGAAKGWLHASYYQAGSESVTEFLARQTRELFNYTFGSAPVAGLAALLVLAGLVVLAKKRSPAFLLILLPYVFGVGVALAGVYPFGGTRHCVYLVPGLCAAVGVSLAEVGARRLWLALLVPAVLICFTWRTPIWLAPAHSRAPMNAAMERLREKVPPGSVVFSDMRMRVVLEYYLGRDEAGSGAYGTHGFWESKMGGYCLIASQLWDPVPKDLSKEMERMIKAYRLPSGQSFWVAHLGSVGDPTGELTSQFPGTVIPTRLDELRLFQVWPGGAPLIATAGLASSPS